MALKFRKKPKISPKCFRQIKKNRFFWEFLENTYAIKKPQITFVEQITLSLLLLITIEKLVMDYPTKNIVFPSKTNYILKIIEKKQQVFWNGWGNQENKIEKR